MSENQVLFHEFYESPLGKIEIFADSVAVLSIGVVDDSPPNDCPPNEITALAAEQLDEYFSGKRTVFSLPLSPKGTEFQKKVWNALLEIPFGETKSYKQIAGEIGNPLACRAVGLANNKNPIMIVVPCHRVIGANGKMVGYASGVHNKQYLLELENAPVLQKSTK